MNARWIGFGEIEIGGERYTHDVVVDRGKVARRVKKPSKRHRVGSGHTPLSADEAIPWGGTRLIVGTGAYGALPIAPGVWEEAKRRGIEIVAAPTDEALRVLAGVEPKDARAILHVTC